METTLFWLYLANTLTLIIPEVDSAYWQEWKLFHPHLLHPPRLSGIQDAPIPGDPLGHAAAFPGAIGRDHHATGLTYPYGGPNDCAYDLDKKTSPAGLLHAGLRAFVDG